MRHGVALVIVAALAAFTLGALRPPEQVVVAMPVTTTTTVVPTTVLPTTTTTSVVVDREIEIEEILRDFYFGWFDGIYRQNVDTLDRVAGSTEVFESGVAAFGKPKYTAAPTREAVGVEVKNVLLDRPDCLVVSADIDFRSFIDIDRVMPAVDVFFRVGDGWGRAVSYQYEKEMWQFACDYMPRR
ncbi:MAG: hypothetical protein WD532_03045 [Acidimicrobiia bacterium]